MKTLPLLLGLLPLYFFTYAQTPFTFDTTYVDTLAGKPAYNLIQGHTSNFVIAGRQENLGEGQTNLFLTAVDDQGVIKWDYTYGGARTESDGEVIPSWDSGYMLVGTTFSYGAQLNDVVLFKLDSLGQEEWRRIYGEVEIETGRAIIASALSNQN